MRDRVLGVVVAAVLVFVMNAAGARADTSITQPTAGHIVITMPNNATTLTVSGTTTVAGNVDILCYFGSQLSYDYQLLAANVTVTSNAFSTALKFPQLPFGACTMRAVPTGTKPTDLTPFTGPQVVADYREPYTLTSGPNSGNLYDYYFSNQQSQAYNDVLSVSSCGLCDTRLFTDPTNFYNSRYLFFGNAALYSDEGLKTNDRGYAQIDGHNALFSYSAQQANPNGSGFPKLTMTGTFAPGSDDMTISENEDAVRCPTDVLPYGTGPGQNSCPTFLPTGVHLHRTIVQTDGGAVVQIVDVFSSTDGTAHSLNLDYDQSFPMSKGLSGQPPAYVPSFEFPWVSPNYLTHTTGDMIPAAPSQPVSIFVKANSSAADGDSYYPQGAITVDPAPSGAKFYSTFSPANEFALNFQRRVPAGGTLTIKETFSIGATRAALAELAAQAADQQQQPQLSIGSPANRAMVTTPSVTVTGTATAGSGITQLTVNGHPVGVGAGGAFSTQVKLTPGSNTITAVADTGAGNQDTASVSVNYLKLILVGTPTPSAAGVGFSLLCRAAVGTVCRGLAQLSTVEKLLGIRIIAFGASGQKRHTRRVTIGSTSFRLSAGQTKKFTVLLNQTGKRLFARFKRIPATLEIALLTTSPPTVLTARTTIKPNKKPKRKHH